jgi:hypothetical protein
MPAQKHFVSIYEVLARDDLFTLVQPDIFEDQVQRSSTSTHFTSSLSSISEGTEPSPIPMAQVNGGRPPFGQPVKSCSRWDLEVGVGVDTDPPVRGTLLHSSVACMPIAISDRRYAPQLSVSPSSSSLAFSRSLSAVYVFAGTIFAYPGCPSPILAHIRS